MKKFLAFLVILLILGAMGIVFYLGWIQIRLGENDYGVVFSKTGGYGGDLLEPGEFNWRWEALIPTNLTLHVFHLEPQYSRVSLKGELPSGKLYGQFFDGRPDFSYGITLSLSYRLKPEKLPELVREAHLTPQGLSQWYREQEDAALAEASRLLGERMKDSDFPGTGRSLPGGLEEEVAEGLNAAFPELNFTGTRVINLRLPDGELYRRARTAYFSLMETQRELSAQALEKTVSLTMGRRADLELLRSYGELLTTYPTLLEYLELYPESIDKIFYGAVEGE